MPDRPLAADRLTWFACAAHDDGDRTMPERSGPKPPTPASPHWLRLGLLALSAALGAPAAAAEDASRNARIRAAAAALATADTVRRSCPALQVDAGVEARMIASSGLDRATLRAKAGYRDQAVADYRIRFADGRSPLTCEPTLSAHDAIAPGLIRRR